MRVYPYYTHLFICPNCREGCGLCEGAATTESHIATCTVVEELQTLAAELDATLTAVRRALED